MGELLNLSFTKAHAIDGRCQLAKYLKANDFDYSNLTEDDFEFNEDGTVDKSCNGYLEIEDAVGECNFVNKAKILTGMKESLGKAIIFTASGKIDSRCQIARDIVNNGGDIEEISQYEFVFYEDTSVDKSCDGYQAVQEILGPVDFHIKEAQTASAKSEQVKTRTIEFKADSEIDKRCQIAKDLKYTTVDFSQLRKDKFAFDSNGFALKDCEGYEIISEILGDHFEIFAKDQELWGASQIQVPKPKPKPAMKATSVKVAAKPAKVAPCYEAQKNATKQWPSCSQNKAKIVIKPSMNASKRTIRRIPKEYYEFINSIIPDDAVDDQFWDDADAVFNSKENTATVRDPNESCDPNVLSCLANRQNLSSTEASLRLGNIWQAIVELNFPLDYKKYAREAISQIKDQYNHCIVRKNAKLNL